MPGPGWLWGLLPLAALWAAGNLFLDEPIRRDLAQRAVASVRAVAGTAPAMQAPLVALDGRDVAVTGEAATAEGAVRGMEALRATFGVRRALGGLSQAVARDPYDWMATRDAQGVVLGGAVPDESTARELVAHARALLPDLRIEDRQELAFGAPQRFEAAARALLARLPGLAEGRVALNGARLCVEGTAANAETYAGLRDLSGLAPAGFEVIDCPVQPPPAAPYRWRAERSRDGAIRVTGHYPDDAARDAIGAALRRSFPEPATVEERMTPASGAPAGFASRVERAIGDLARLRDGVVAIEGDAYRVRGTGPEDPAICAAMRKAIAEAEAGEGAAPEAIVCPPPAPAAPQPRPAPPPAEPARAARPPALTLALDGRALTLSGDAPAPDAFAAVEALVGAMRPELRIDTLFTPGGASGGLPGPDLLAAAVSDLLRLELGSVEVSGTQIGLRGITCRPLIRDEVRKGALARMAPGADIAIRLRQTGCMLGPAAICQNRLDALARGQPILLVQGAGVATLDAATARFVDEAVAILDGCPASRVVVEGHANRDGAEHGFDNRELSQRRAQRLRDELVGRGIAEERLEIRGFGAERPLVAPDSPQARTVNRRLQFSVIR